jgi:hypothetical protein
MSPRVLVAQVGSDFNLGVLATGAVNLSRLTFTMEWDGENLEYRSIAAGNLLGQSGENPSFRFRRLGSNQVEVSTAVSTGTGVTGSGAVALARFRATAKGAITLRFVDAQATDAEGNAIEVQMTEGRVTVP